MDGISIAESHKAKRDPKVLNELNIKPRLGGGHIITHYYTSYQHEPKVYEFAKDEGEEAMQHLAHHAGLPHPSFEEQGGSKPEPVDEEEED